MAEPTSGKRVGFDGRIKVSVADYAVASGKTLTTSGLGSCLGIALYDPSVGVGGLVHPMLPNQEDAPDRPPERFVDSGIELVVNELEAQGATRGEIMAKMTGGAAVVDFASDDGPSIGERNIATAREVLAAEGIEIAGEEVGGDNGRTMRFETVTGSVIVKRTDGVETLL